MINTWIEAVAWLHDSQLEVAVAVAVAVVGVVVVVVGGQLHFYIKEKDNHKL